MSEPFVGGGGFPSASLRRCTFSGGNGARRVQQASRLPTSQVPSKLTRKISTCPSSQRPQRAQKYVFKRRTLCRTVKTSEVRAAGGHFLSVPAHIVSSVIAASFNPIISLSYTAAKTKTPTLLGIDSVRELMCCNCTAVRQLLC